jgi:hypothetical protein
MRAGQCAEPLARGFELFRAPPRPIWFFLDHRGF